jgi:hypothetical protein
MPLVPWVILAPQETKEVIKRTKASTTISRKTKQDKFDFSSTSENLTFEQDAMD